jgi:putative drug exporter of the RND superfamily
VSGALERLGRFAARRPWVVIATWAVVCVVVVTSAAAFGRELDDPFEAPGLDSQRATELLTRAGSADMGLGADVVLTPRDAAGTFGDASAARADVDRVQAAVAALPHVLGTTDLVSPDGRVALIRIQYPERAELSPADLANLKTTLDDLRGSTDLRIEAGGDLYFAFEQPPSGVGEALGLAVAIVILLLAFGSIVAMGLPIGTALLGLAVGAGSLSLVAYVVDIPSWAVVIGSMIGLGVGIDYALFILTRHRQNLAAGHSVPVAIGRANATAGLSVLFAGVTVMVAILGLKLSGIPMMEKMGYASAIMVAAVMLASITLLPAILGIVKHRVNSARIPFVKQKPADNPDAASAKWAARVVAKPVRYGGAAAVILGILAIPAFSMHLGFADAGNDAPDTTTRKSYDLMAEGYGAGINGPLEVVLEADGAAIPNGAIERVSTSLASEPGVATVNPPSTNGTRDIAIISVIPTTSPQDERTGKLLEHIRADLIPAALEGSDVEASVTGQTALTNDVSSRLEERMPLFLGAVIGLSFLLLMIVFRSVLVPLKAAVLNVLGVSAAYGVVVAVFQWGWFANLIGVHESVPIMPLAPMLMFAILFGLSMDYEVFLMSRVREQYRKHFDPRRAVVEGVGSTARVITSAALIMIGVFSSFMLDVDVTTKMFGLGLAVAVLLDVTLIRMVLVPAAMSLLGHRAWWLPAWLARRLPAIDIEGGAHDGEEQPVAEPVAAEQERMAALV